MTKAEDLVPKAARNEMFYFIARLSMIGASVLGAPLAIWLLTRVTTQADELTKAVIQQNVELKVLSSHVEDSLKNNVQQLSDHELRLRSLERGK